MSVPELVGKHPDDARWLLHQDWFRKKFPVHAESIRLGGYSRAEIKPEERTPEHNRLQNQFLNPGYARAFVGIAVGWDSVNSYEAKVRGFAKMVFEDDPSRRRTWIRQSLEHVSSWKAKEAQRTEWVETRIQELSDGHSHLRLIFTGGDGKSKPLSREIMEGFRLAPFAVFEKDAVDVHLSAFSNVEYVVCGKGENQTVKLTEIVLQTRDMKIEVKPSISDDYPIVLRQVGQSKCDYLLVNRFEAEGVTRQEFVEIFRRGGVRVVFHDDVVAEVTAQ
jgi:hypothetical protein